MPLYEYHCFDCDLDFEVRHGYDDPPVVEHAECRGHRVSRKISPSALKFTGSGFYCTDYPSDK